MNEIIKKNGLTFGVIMGLFSVLAVFFLSLVSVPSVVMLRPPMTPPATPHYLLLGLTYGGEWEACSRVLHYTAEGAREVVASVAHLYAATAVARISASADTPSSPTTSRFHW